MAKEIKNELFEVLKKLCKEAETLKNHVIEQGYIDWEDESIDGCKDMDNAILSARNLIIKYPNIEADENTNLINEICNLETSNLFLEDEVKRLKNQRNNIHAAALSFIRGVERGDIVIYPNADTKCNYLQQLENAVIKANQETFNRA